MSYRRFRTIKIGVPSDLPEHDLINLKEQLERHLFVVGKYYSEDLDKHQAFSIVRLREYSVDELKGVDTAISFSDVDEVNLFIDRMNWPAEADPDCLLTSYVDKHTVALKLRRWERTFAPALVRAVIDEVIGARTTIKIDGLQHFPPLNIR